MQGRGRGGILASPDVSAQQFLLSEALAAGQAGEWLLSSVSPGVSRQVAPLQGGEQPLSLQGCFVPDIRYRKFFPPQR